MGKRGHSQIIVVRGTSGRPIASVKRRRVTSMALAAASEAKGQRSGNEINTMPGVWNDGIFGFPRNLITRMRYVTNLTLTPTTSVAGTTFRMNSIFQVNSSASSGQPMYRDEFAALYNHYTVLGSKLTAAFVPVSATTPLIVGVAEGDDAVFSTSVATLSEKSKSQYTIIPGAAGGGRMILTATYGSERDEGIDPYAGSDLVRTAMGANPTEAYFAHVWGIGYDFTTSTPYNVQITVEFTVLLAELADVASS